MLRSHPCGSVPSAEVAYNSAPLVAQKDAVYQGLEEERDANRSAPYQPASELSSELIAIDQLLSSVFLWVRRWMNYCGWKNNVIYLSQLSFCFLHVTHPQTLDRVDIE